MAYQYHSQRALRRYSQKSKKRLIFTLIITIFLLYITLVWILPFFINSVGLVKNTLKPSKQNVVQKTKENFFAPPVLNIPFEATNSAQINITGFGTANSKAKLYLDDREEQSVDVSEDGTFTFENVSLSLGINNIYGTTLDDNNKESLPSKTIKLIYDNEKPSLSVNEPEDNKTITGGDKKVRVAGKTDPEVKVFINDTQVIVSRDGNFNVDEPLNDGENIITVKAVSPANNTAEIQRRVIFKP